MALKAGEGKALASQRKSRIIRCGHCGQRRRMLARSQYCSGRCRTAAYRQRKAQAP